LKGGHLWPPSFFVELEMFGLGGMEILIVLVMALIFFGAGKLPKIGSSLGRSVRSFRQGVADGEAIEVEPVVEQKKSTKD
jgi:sec-independent protein translocase protein TatA